MNTWFSKYKTYTKFLLDEFTSPNLAKGEKREKITTLKGLDRMKLLLKQKLQSNYSEMQKQVDLDNEKRPIPNSCFLELLLTSAIEVSSFFDFISDGVILKALCMSPDTAWFSFALFTMLCPYYTVYTSLTNF